MATRIACAEQGGTFWTQGEALKTVLDRDAVLAPVALVAAPGASVETAEALDAGTVELGFMAANWVPRAARGEAPFEAPVDLRVVAAMNAGPLFFIARADASLRSVADLAGKRVVHGPEKSGMTQHARLMLRLLGIEATPLYLDFAGGSVALEQGAADAQLQCPIPNRVMTELSERVAIRVLPYAPGQLDRLLAAVPYYRAVMMRRGALSGLTEDVARAGVLNMLVAHARLPERIAHKAAHAIAAGADELAALNPLFAGLGTLLREAGAHHAGEVGLHPGAAQAYRDRGLLT
jgi:hypothetical protein